MVTGSGQHPRREEGRWVRLAWSGCPSTVVVCLPTSPPTPTLTKGGEGKGRRSQNVSPGAGAGRPRTHQAWLNPASLSLGQLLPFTPWPCLPIWLRKESGGWVGPGPGRISSSCIPGSFPVSCVVSALGRAGRGVVCGRGLARASLPLFGHLSSETVAHAG